MIARSLSSFSPLSFNCCSPVLPLECGKGLKRQRLEKVDDDGNGMGIGMGMGMGIGRMMVAGMGGNTDGVMEKVMDDMRWE